MRTEMIRKFDLTGKKAIITGVGSLEGIGRYLAEGLCESGAQVVLINRSERMYKVRDFFRERGFSADGVVADLTDRVQLDDAFRQSMELLGGRLDIRVNCAGMQKRMDSVDFSREDWDAVVALNLNAVFFLSQLAAREMEKQHKGKIINIASMTSFFGSERIPAYTASKAGIAQLTKALSNEWARSGVNVNAIAPGYMATKLTQDIKEKNPKQYQEITSRIPAGRWGTGEDLKGLAVFLASDASAYISGAVIPVDGGYLGK